MRFGREEGTLAPIGWNIEISFVKWRPSESTHSAIGLVAQLQLFSGVQRVVNVDALIQWLKVDVYRVVLQRVVCEEPKPSATEPRLHSC